MHAIDVEDKKHCFPSQNSIKHLNIHCSQGKLNETIKSVNLSRFRYKLTKYGVTELTGGLQWRSDGDRQMNK